MRKILLVAVAAMMLSGCATTNGGSGFPDAATLRAKVQEYTQRVCGFIPLVDNGVITGLLLAFYPAGVPIQQAVVTVGEAICAGVTPPQASRSRGAMTQKIVQTPKGPVAVPGKYVR
jgi:Prokaryotic membrane lipoprotein lipid attachment site